MNPCAYRGDLRERVEAVEFRPYRQEREVAVYQDPVIDKRLEAKKNHQKILRITCGYPGGLRPRRPPSGMLIPPSPAPGLMGGGPDGIFLDVPGISIIHRSLVFLGRRIKRKMGKYLRNRILIQFGIEWVLGPL